MKIKNKLNILAQDIKGQLQQEKGRMEVANGQPEKGTLDETRGKINVATAKIRNKLDKI